MVQTIAKNIDTYNYNRKDEVLKLVDLIGQFKNNILSNQIAGESTRIGLMLNVNQVIEVFTDSIDGFLKIQVVPLGAYIKEEYLHYGPVFYI